MDRADPDDDAGRGASPGPGCLLTEGLESADATLAPYRRLGKPIKDAVGPVHYVQLQTQDDERARIGGRYYTKSGFVEPAQR